MTSDRHEERELAADDVADPAEDGRAERPHREAGTERGERSEERRGRVVLREELRGEERGEDAVQVEVVPLDDRSRRRGADHEGQAVGRATARVDAAMQEPPSAASGRWAGLGWAAGANAARRASQRRDMEIGPVIAGASQRCGAPPSPREGRALTVPVERGVRRARPSDSSGGGSPPGSRARIDALRPRDLDAVLVERGEEPLAELARGGPLVRARGRCPGS